MGARGPGRTPTAVKIAQGETRPSRVNYEEPQPKGAPLRPEGVDARALVVFDRVIADAPAGLLTSLDSEVLRLYCEAVARYIDANEIVRRAPMVKRGWFWALDESDPPKEVRQPIWVKNPMHQVVRDNAEQIRLLARELGFSPSARANLHIELAGGGSHVPGLDDELGQTARLRLLRTGTDDD